MTEINEKILVVDAALFSPGYNYSLLTALSRHCQNITYAHTVYPYEPRMSNIPSVGNLCCFFFIARLFHAFIKNRRLRRALRALEYPFDWLFLFGYIFKKRIYIVHFMWILSPQFDLIIIKCLKRMGRRVVLTAHNPFPHDQKRPHCSQYGAVYEAVDHIIVLSDYSKKMLENNFGISAQKVSVIPHGDFKSLFSQYGFNNQLARRVKKAAAGRHVIAFLGTIRPYKGLSVFIEAMPLIKGLMPDCFFLVAGSTIMYGGKEQWAGEIVRAGGDDQSWVDIRFIPTEDLKAYLSVTEVLVQPYVSASQSGNTVMAYAEGIPVVSTNVGGLGEMTEHGKTGYIVPPQDPRALCDAVVGCFKPENYSEFSGNARELAKAKYSWNRIAEQTAQVYLAAFSGL